MTNTEIIDEILRIHGIKNACDRAVELKKFEKQYKKTKFYKQTRKPLQTLYYEMVIEDTLSLRTVFQSLKDFINTLDAEKITKLFDDLNLESFKTITAGMDSIEESGLADIIKSVKR